MSATSLTPVPDAAELAAAPRVSASRRRRRPAASAGKALGVAALLVFSLFPAYWMLTTSIDGSAATRGAHLWPQHVTWANYHRVLHTAGFLHYMRNSALLALGTVLCSGLVCLLAAVAVARHQFRGRRAVMIAVLIVQMVPLEALVIPLFLQAKNLGMLNSLLGLMIVYLTFSLPFGIWNLRGFVAAVPKEIEEAAYVDGASWPQMFWRVLLPLVAPGLVATSVFSFITAWDEFIFALTFLQDQNKYTVAIGLQKFFGENSADWGPIMAGSSLLTVPIVIFFLLVQRNMVSGLGGAVKG